MVSFTESRKVSRLVEPIHKHIFDAITESGYSLEYRRFKKNDCIEYGDEGGVGLISDEGEIYRVGLYKTTEDKFDGELLTASTMWVRSPRGVYVCFARQSILSVQVKGPRLRTRINHSVTHRFQVPYIFDNERLVDMFTDEKAIFVAGILNSKPHLPTTQQLQASLLGRKYHYETSGYRTRTNLNEGW